MQWNLSRGELNQILPNFVQHQLDQILIETNLTELGQILYRVTPTQSNTTKFGLVSLNFKPNLTKNIN